MLSQRSPEDNKLLCPPFTEIIHLREELRCWKSGIVSHQSGLGGVAALAGGGGTALGLTTRTWSTYAQPTDSTPDRQGGLFFFSRFKFILSYCPGSKNMKSDALSLSLSLVIFSPPLVSLELLHGELRIRFDKLGLMFVYLRVILQIGCASLSQIAGDPLGPRLPYSQN